VGRGCSHGDRQQQLALHLHNFARKQGVEPIKSNLHSFDPFI
jgi:hypothetical protein